MSSGRGVRCSEDAASLRTATRTVVDPFCGHGTALAVANAFGFHAIGIDTSARQCRAAKALRLEL